MLLAEAVIAEVLGGLFLAYSCVKHVRGSEGMALAVLVCSLVLLVGIPLTVHFSA